MCGKPPLMIDGACPIVASYQCPITKPKTNEKKPVILIAVGTILIVIGFAIPGVFPGVIFTFVGGGLLGSGLIDLLLLP